jgi:predicted acylesterase/phospholipase RssA/CRP-like cAMP-binding protein
MIKIDKKMNDILSDYFEEELPPEILEQLETKSLKGGEWLFKQGDAGDSLYFLIRGRLQTWLEADTANDQAARMLGEIAPGDSVGEVGLISGEQRSASMQAVRDSLLIRINHQLFGKLAKTYPGLVLKIAANVAKLLQRRTTNSVSPTNKMNTISLLPIGDNEKIKQFFDDFTHQYRQNSSIIVVEPDQFKALNAPDTNYHPDQELPAELKNWLFDLESHYDLVLFKCTAVNDSWTQFVERQSDIILIVADANNNPEEIDWDSYPDCSQGKDTGRQALILLQDDRTKIKNTLRWLDGRKYNFHLHIQSGLISDIQRAVRIFSGKSVGLVIGGGAARGLAGIGVYKAMVEAKVYPDWVGGTSMGSIVAAVFAVGLSTEEVYQRSYAAFKVGKPFSDITIPVISLIRGKRMERLLKVHLDYQIEDLALPYFCVSTNLGRGTKNIHERGCLVHAIRASAALPGVMPPVVVDQELAIDGAVLDNLPVDIMQQKPVAKVIAVEFSITTPMKVDYTELPSPWAILAGRWLPFTKKYRVPKLTSIIMKSSETATLQEVRKHGLMADLLISPDIKRFGITDVKSFDQIVEAGYVCAVEELKNWTFNQNS